MLVSFVAGVYDFIFLNFCNSDIKVTKRFGVKKKKKKTITLQ